MSDLLNTQLSHVKLIANLSWQGLQMQIPREWTHQDDSNDISQLPTFRGLNATFRKVVTVPLVQGISFQESKHLMV